MENENFQIAEDYIIHVLSIVQSNLGIAAVKETIHFLTYGEYEMSFEGLFIEIMNLTTIPPIDFVEALKVARLLKLDEESVFDSDFWIKFEKYIASQVTGK
jgi:hypothetical protein